MKSRLAAVLLAALSAAMAGHAVAQAPVARSDEVRYVVRAGDTLIDLARRYMVHPDVWPEVQSLNGVANPRRMPIGLVLRVPRRLLRGVPIGATIFAFRGEVAVGGAGGSRQARVNMPIAEQDRIVTAAKSFVTVRLADGSRFSLPSNSQVRVRRLRRLLLTGEVERSFAVERGRGEWEVVPSSRKDPFSVTTPVATAAVRGTAFRVEVGAPERAAFGVVEGAVAVTAPEGDADPLLEAGTGLAASRAGIGEPVPLLPQPAPLEPGRVHQAEDVVLATAPVAGARRYRFALSLDPGGERMIAAVDTEEPRGNFPGIADGRYFARASAIDPQGIEGLAASWPVARQINAVTASVAVSGRRNGRSVYNFRWASKGEGAARYRFSLSRDREGRDTVVAHEGLSGNGVSVGDLPDGVYWWRVGSVRTGGDGAGIEAMTEPQELVVGARP